MIDNNSVVKYEYFLPISNENTTNVSVQKSEHILKTVDESSTSRTIAKNRYNWKVVGFNECSKSCGGGLQAPIIKCVRDNPNRFFAPRKCIHSKKPLLNENLLRCNTQPCPAYWRTEDWKHCNCSELQGVSLREVMCVQELSSGIVIQVNKSNCVEERPISSRNCECPKSSRHSKSRPRQHHSMERKKNSKLLSINGTGIWIYSNWSGHCSSQCNGDLEYRSIFCDRSGSHKETCDISSAPELSRPCNNENFCDKAQWFTGPWSECSGNCFNLTKKRQVICILNNLISDDEDCKSSKKPHELLRCSIKDVDYCKPKWHYSDWTEVSSWYKLILYTLNIFEFLVKRKINYLFVIYFYA